MTQRRSQNGVLFIANSCDCLEAFNARTGSELYNDDNGQHFTFGQPVVSGGTVYTGGIFTVYAYRP